MTIVTCKILPLSIAVGILVPNVVLAEQIVIQSENSSATVIGDRTS
ncbi:MAG: hypothetical protein AAGE96_08360 [Cyanobacteria bacterium P01_G01_bin.19]